MSRRDYDAIAATVTARLAPSPDRDHAMRTVADALWEGLSATGVSWAGFYVDRPEEPDDRRLVLGPHRDGPACSPIGVHGVCGQALRARAVRIVDDVAALGDAYVACDPRDRAEIVVPLLDANGRVWGVLDLDARETASFDGADASGLVKVLEAAGFRATAAEAGVSSPPTRRAP